jgi:hypothetical protein
MAARIKSMIDCTDFIIKNSSLNLLHILIDNNASRVNLAAGFIIIKNSI